MEAIKESITFERDALREKFVAGKIFNIGDKVKDDNGTYEIVDRGANYISVVNESGDISKKWLDAVTPVKTVKEDAPVPGTEVPDEITYKGYTTKNFKYSKDAAEAFLLTIQRAQDPVAILGALKATDGYMAINDRHLKGEELTPSEMSQWRDLHSKAREYLQKIGEFNHHLDYWHMHEHEMQDLNTNYPEAADKAEVSESLEEAMNPTDKIKAARVIATAFGIEDADKSSNPDQLVNNALRKIRNKSFSPASLEIIKNMIDFAKSVGIKVDDKLIPTNVKNIEEAAVEVDSPNLPGSSMNGPAPQNSTLRKMKIKHQLGEEGEEPEGKEDEKNEVEPDDEDDLSDEDIKNMIDGFSDDDIIEHGYDDDEFDIIDGETAEKVDDLKEEVINEVLSRMERIKSKIRFARTQTKRERKLQIALKSRSSTKTVNKRARRLAITAMKQRLVRNRPLSSLSVAEKERIEGIIQRRKKVIDRIAMRMVPRVRRLESDRLSHSSYTK